ncbi:signal peptidase I [Paramicrobacterium chengjingii]|uniref:Signal peptidase I n=1 Tax=Paramicrobacterium chengjingii TaxID=2769067 RepID=A0ABX6YGE7_9MICO|nr:signal peptidase I [Microbacterium chengjingii]
MGSLCANENEKSVGLFRRIVGSFWFNLLAAFFVLAVMQLFVVKLYSVPSGSMENTLEIGDKVLVSRLAYIGSEPTVGDVVVFDASATWDESRERPTNPIEYAVKWLGGLIGVGPSLDHTLVKRVVAGPGQTIACCGDTGQMLVDGEPLEEPYVVNDFLFVPGQVDCSTEPMSRRCVDEFTVPAEQYVVLGDSRANSSDSLIECRGSSASDNCVRTVQRSDIVGKLFTVVWPIGNLGAPAG